MAFLAFTYGKERLYFPIDSVNSGINWKIVGEFSGASGPPYRTVQRYSARQCDKQHGSSRLLVISVPYVDKSSMLSVR